MGRLPECATFYQHPNAPVVFDPPVTEDSIARALKAAEAERQEIARYQALRDEHKLLLSHMVDIHGWAQVSDWLMGIQRIHNDLRRG